MKLRERIGLLLIPSGFLLGLGGVVYGITAYARRVSALDAGLPDPGTPLIAGGMAFAGWIVLLAGVIILARD